MKNILHLFFLALICMGLWVGEIIIRDWTGLEWLNYFHWAIVIIVALICIWTIKTNGIFVARKYLYFYPLWIIAYIAYLIILISTYPTDFRYYSMVRGAASSATMHYIPLIFFPIYIFLLNLWAARIEHRKLSLSNKITLIFSSLLIPSLSILFAMLLFTQSYLFPPTPPDPIQNGLEPIHWLKSGSLIFAVIFYEGVYFLWIKEKILL